MSTLGMSLPPAPPQFSYSPLPGAPSPFYPPSLTSLAPPKSPMFAFPQPSPQCFARPTFPTYSTPSSSAYLIPSSSSFQRPTTLSLPKLPLQLTRSIEEMLRPPGLSADDPSYNNPLAKDWADSVGYSTPVFNREIVSKFFPEINRRDL